MIFQKLAILALTAVISLTAAHSQEQPMVKTAILSYSPANLPEGFTAFYKTSDFIAPFSPGASSLGIPVVYTGTRRFVIRATKEEFELPPEELKLKQPLAYVDLPAQSDMVLILALPDENGGVRLGAYDISSNSLREGEYRVFNFSTRRIAVILGEQKFAIAPGKDTLVKDSAWHDGLMALPLQIAIYYDKKPKPVYSSFWEHYPMRRSMLFLFDGNHPSKPIAFSSFDAGTPPKTAPDP